MALAKLVDYNTSEILKGHISEGLAGALADAANESDTGVVCARKVGDTWHYVRESERQKGDVLVYCE